MSAEERLANAESSIRWLMGELLDARGERQNDRHIASHFCDFDYNPHYGACYWHEQWVKAAETCGLLDEWADDDIIEQERIGEAPMQLDTNLDFGTTSTKPTRWVEAEPNELPKARMFPEDGASTEPTEAE